MKRIAIVLIAAVTGFTGITPADAGQKRPIHQMPTSTSYESVQWKGDREWRRDARRWHGNRPDHYYWKQHRDQRGWRRHNRSDAAAIIGGLAAGAIIGGAISQSQQLRSPESDRLGADYGNDHAKWCAARYRTYRAFDDSFQPNSGARQLCASPYR